jgi:glutamate-1-semialdehyde 2,1-aminomutase
MPKPSGFSLERSKVAFERCKKSIAGGESSYVRIGYGHLPTVIARGKGPRMWDVDGNEYIDFNLAYGPLFMGHVPEMVTAAVAKQITEYGSDFGFPHELDFLAGELVQELVPCIDQLRFANSGTEAIASAIRLARAYTGKQKIVIFEGHYHGWSEPVFRMTHPPLSAIGTERFPKSVPMTPGMTTGSLDETIVLSWNRPEMVELALRRHSDEIACVLTEPIMGNTGVIEPEPGYLQHLRDLTNELGILLVFDEVITGFRVAAGGAQELYGVVPDLCTLAKALGAGYPVAAFGGSNEVMELEATNEVFHGGTYAGNPMALAAAVAVLGVIKSAKDEIYPRLERLTQRMSTGLREILERHEIACVAQGAPGMFQLFLTREPVARITNYREAALYSDADLFRSWQHALQRHGVYFHPSQFECFFISTSHADADIDEALERAETATKELQHQRRGPLA